MRRVSLLLATALLAGIVGTADAGSRFPASGEPSEGGISSKNVKFVKHVPWAIDGTGGRIVGNYFYVNDQHKVMIYKISKPANPKLVGVLPMPQEAIYSREDLDTNGRILLVPNLGRLHVVDVEDKANPTIIATHNGGGDHTNSCVLNCRWSYGSEGTIIDLRNPRKPKVLNQEWGDGMPATDGHDVTEVAPGIILTASQPMMLLDARKDPANPKLLAVGVNSDFRFIHSVLWPRRMRDKFIIAGGETNNRVRCSANTGAFMTWSTNNWRRTHSFHMIDEFRMKNGTFTDGDPTVNAMGCSSHWIETHPTFDNGGLVAGAFFEHGTRFINVSGKGQIKQIGYFMPWAGSTGAVYWASKRIVYAVDYTRGIDILKYTGKF